MLLLEVIATAVADISPLSVCARSRATAEPCRTGACMRDSTTAPDEAHIYLLLPALQLAIQVLCVAWNTISDLWQTLGCGKMVALMSRAMTFLSNRVTPVGARCMRQRSWYIPRSEEKWIVFIAAPL